MVNQQLVSYNESNIQKILHRFLLTNEPLRFQTTTVIETGIYDFHKMIVAVMKMHFP